MSIAFFCAHCGKGHVVRDEHAGKPAQCSCGNAIVVPFQSEPPPLPAWTPPPPIAFPVAPPPPAVAWPVGRSTPGTSWLAVAGIAAGSAVVAALIVVAVVLPTRTNGTPAIASTPPPRVVAAVRPTPAAPATPSATLRSQMAQAMSSMDLAASSPPAVTFPPPRPGFAPPPVITTTRQVSRNWPADAEWTTPTPGIREMRVIVDTATGQKTQLRVYLPADAAAGGAKLPCVFIAPAGSRLYHGMDLVNADAAEHWPYVRAGFAVIAYSVSGPLPATDVDDPKAVRRAFDDFARAAGGLFNAAAAMDYATARRPEIDRDRFYLAGHSSAGTVALLVAARDWRVKGCCAYAPVVDLDAHFAEDAATLEKTLFGFKMRTRMLSPIALPKPRGPVMLFHADDDATVPGDDLRRYVERIGARLMTVPTGGHYQSMIDRGIPAGIEFLKQIDAAPRSGRP